MDPPQCVSAQKVLNVLLARIAAHEEPGTFVEIYPLINNPNTQLLPNVHKYHIQGLLFQLGLLKTRRGAIQFVSDATLWNNLLEDELSYSFTLKMIKTKKGLRRSMCLDVMQSVDVETADLSRNEMGFLELCRSSFKEILSLPSLSNYPLSEAPPFSKCLTSNCVIIVLLHSHQQVVQSTLQRHHNKSAPSCYHLKSHFPWL